MNTTDPNQNLHVLGTAAGRPVVPTPKVSVGLGSVLGAGATVLGAAGATWAAIEGKDFPTAVGAGTALVAALGTLGARTAQSLALIRRGAHIARPYLESALAVLDPETDAVGDEDLPADDVELASPPPDESNTPVQPSQAGLTEA
jgi:hypothetical protein